MLRMLLHVRGLGLLVLWLCGCVVEYTVPLETDGVTDGGGTDSMGCDDAGLLCDNACVDPLTDPDHCGDCDVVCGAGEACVAGTCSSVCSDSLSVCDRSCVDLATDLEHCGQCGEHCDDGGACVAGYCQDACMEQCDDERELCVDGACQCREGFTQCGDTCVDLRRDPSNCGACGNDCGGLPCGDFDCQAAGCPGFPDQCGDSCTDVSSDPLHCGGCDDACDADQTCIVAECEELEDESDDS